MGTDYQNLLMSTFNKNDKKENSFNKNSKISKTVNNNSSTTPYFEFIKNMVKNNHKSYHPG